MICPKIEMFVRYLDEEGDEHSVGADSIIFGCGFSGNECEITDEDGNIVYCDTSALLEIRLS